MSPQQTDSPLFLARREAAVLILARLRGYASGPRISDLVVWLEDHRAHVPRSCRRPRKAGEPNTNKVGTSKTTQRSPRHD